MALKATSKSNLLFASGSKSVYEEMKGSLEKKENKPTLVFFNTDDNSIIANDKTYGDKETLDDSWEEL